MVDKRPHIFDAEGAERIVHAVEAVENLNETISWAAPAANQIGPVQGKMLANLSAGLEFGANPPTAEMQVYYPDPDPSNNNQLIDAGYSITVTNRDPDVEKSINDWCRVIFLNGEWQPYRVGVTDPACQSSPTTKVLHNYYVRLTTLNYWRSMNTLLGQFSAVIGAFDWNSFVSNFTSSRTRRVGSPYDRTEWCNSRHGTALYRSDFNLLHNVVTAQNAGGALPLGANISVVATENDGSNPQNITATWDGNWTSPRWEILSSIIIDGVELQGYISHSLPEGQSHKLRWFFDNASDNPNPDDEDQDGASGTTHYDAASIDWCGRTASYLFGAGGPRATVTWSKQNPRRFWWNPGGGGSLIDVASGTHDAIDYWFPVGGTAADGSAQNFASGTKVDLVYNEKTDDGGSRTSFLSPATGTAGVDWWYDYYPALNVEMPDMSWAGAGAAEYWDDNGTAWEYDRPTASWSPQTGWSWTGRVYFYDTGSGLAGYDVLLELVLQNTSGLPVTRTWIFSEPIDFSTDFEDKIQLTADFSLLYDSGHPDDDGYGTGAQTQTAIGTGAPADYTFTMPTSFDINFEYRFLR